jgi:excisionase family DNA binding protein
MTELVKVQQAAQAVGIKPSTLYRAIKRSEERAPFYRLGRAVRFDIEELRQWMRDQAKQSADGEAVLA